MRAGYMQGEYVQSLQLRNKPLQNWKYAFWDRMDGIEAIVQNQLTKEVEGIAR